MQTTVTILLEGIISEVGCHPIDAPKIEEDPVFRRMIPGPRYIIVEVGESRLMIPWEGERRSDLPQPGTPAQVEVRLGI